MAETADRLKELMHSYSALVVMPGSETANMLSRLSVNVTIAGQMAPNFDFRHLAYNGIRTILKTAVSYFEIGVKKCKDPHFNQQFASVIQVLDIWLTAIVEDVNVDFTSCTEEQQMRFYSRIFAYDESATRTLLGPDFLCLGMESMRPACHLILRLMIWKRRSKGWHWQLHRPLSLRTKSVASHVAKALPHIKRQDYASFLSFIASPAVNLLTRAAITLSVCPMAQSSVTCKLRQVRVKRVHEIVVEWEKQCVSVISATESSAVDIRFRVLRHKSCVTKGTKRRRLLMYACGGAFMFPATGAAESAILTPIVQNLKEEGIVVLSVCLPTGPFPRAMQCLLDTYSWLTSGDERVEQVIGFTPEDIVLAGDSSGGNQVLSLLILVRELSFEVKPKALVLFFPKTSLQRDVFPSLLLSMYDPFAHKSFLSAACQTYVPVVRRHDSGKGNEDEDNNENYVRVHNSQDLDPDFVTQADHRLISSYILSPIRYDRFDLLSSSSLHVMAMACDPLLDECIQLAKRWHGPVDVQVVERLPHGSLLFHMMSRRAHDCLLTAANIITHAFRGLE